MSRHHITRLQTAALCGKKAILEATELPLFNNWTYAEVDVGRLSGTGDSSGYIEGVFNRVWKETLEDAISSAPIRQEEMLHKWRERILEQCENAFRWFAEQGIEIRQREVPFRYVIGDYPFEGTVDAIAVHPDTPEGMVEIHDYKTGSLQAPQQLNRNMQFIAYHKMLSDNGYKVNRVFWGRAQDLLTYRADGKGGKKGDWRGPFLYPVVVSAEDYGMLEEFVRGTIAKITTATIVAPEPSSLCGMCEVADLCPSMKTGFDKNNSFYDEQLNRRLEESLNGKEESNV
jgi:hypothetical protein